MKGLILMKQKYTEQQYVQLAKEMFCQIIKTVPFVSDIEIIPTGFQRGFGNFHAVVHYSDGDHSQRFCVEVKTNGEKRFVNMFMLEASQYHDDFCYVFMAPYISETSADSLIENNYSYIDLSGNCYILSRRIIIHFKGNENKYIEKRERKNYFSKTSGTASAIMRTMLDSPYSCWQVRSLSEIANRSIGMVSNVKAFLYERDWIEEYPHGFRLKNIKELLYTWAKDYHKKDNRKFEYYSLDSISLLEQKISAWSSKHDNSALLGSFSAAARYAPTVRYNKLEVYVEQQAFHEFVVDMELQPVSTGGNIVITIPHDETPYMFYREINGFLVTSPVQTVIDLLGNAGRGEEAAEAIVAKEYKEQVK